MRKAGSVVLGLLAGTMLAAQAAPQRVSAPGRYEGYAAAAYDGFKRESVYVPMRDGTRIAVDIFRPTKGGQVATEKLPLVWMHSPYNRRTYQGKPAVESYPGYAINLSKYGYNVAVADFRGVYASFGGNLGYNRGEWSEPAKWDAYDLTEWFAKQPYTNGKIGMWGCSATGGSQMQAATTRPPSLKAIIPMSAEFEGYNAFVVGGVAAQRPVGTPGATGNAVAQRDRGAAAVDGPDGAALLAQAVTGHQGNQDSPGSVPNRDSRAPVGGAEWWKLTNPASHLASLKASEFGVMAVANWDEAGTRHGTFWTFNNLPRANTKMLVGPATHCAWSAVKDETGFEFITEELRFYDYWLKGVKNNVMDEPAVTYFTYNAPKASAWRTSDAWPLKNERRTHFYLGENSLSPDRPSAARTFAGSMGASVGATSTTVPAPSGGLNFLTAPLTADTEVTGHPVVNLWLSANTPDADVTAWIHDVAPDGSMKTYQMVGRLRASHRKISAAPYNNLGLPWRSFASTDQAGLTDGGAVELKFDMLPMSYIFQKGHRIRLNLTFANPVGGEGKVTLHQGPGKLSYLTLPVIPAR